VLNEVEKAEKLENEQLVRECRIV